MTDDGFRSASATPPRGPGRAPGRRRRGAGAAAFLALALLLSVVPAGGSAGEPSCPTTDVFPSAARIETLPNGLKIVAVPLPSPNVIAYVTIVRAGSAREIEPASTGLAGLVARMMSSGTATTPRPAYHDALARIGAATRSRVDDDSAIFSVVFAGRENLEAVVRTEADRFINPAFAEGAFRTEAAVVEAEAAAADADPGQRLMLALRGAAFDRHGYKRLPLVSPREIAGLAGRYQEGLLFEKRAYAPDNAILLVAGDFDPAPLAGFVRRYYGAWQMSGYDLRTPAEPPQEQARRVHVEGPADAPARIAIGWHGPAFSDATPDKAALDLAAELLFAPGSPLFERLVVKERTCRALAALAPATRDPSLFVVSALTARAGDLPAVEAEILREIERAKADRPAAARLDEAKSRLRNGLARALESTDAAAALLAGYLSLTGDPGAPNKLVDLYDRITAKDVQDAVRKYLRASNSTTVTLGGGGTN